METSIGTVALCKQSVGAKRRRAAWFLLFALAFFFGIDGLLTPLRANAESVGTLGVKDITAIANEKDEVGVGTKDNTFENGWKWEFAVTLPTDELFLKMRFADWTSGKNAISAGDNIRFYSPQSSNAPDAESAVTISKADEYSGAALLFSPSKESDLDLLLVGRQVRIVVEARIPLDAAGGSYATNYGISSSKDTAAPVMALLGDAAVTIVAGAPYQDAGATATDNVDGDISDQIVVTGIVRNTQIGVYTLTYNVSDLGGNAATPVTRTVAVVAPAPPVIPNTSLLNTLIASAQSLHDGATEGVSAGEYAVGSKETLQATIDATTALKTVAEKGAVSQTEVDAAITELGEAITAFAQAKETGGEKDATPPVIMLVGNAAITITVGSAYQDAGATALDDVDGDITSSIVTSGAVEPSKVGVYELTYAVSDTSGNEAVPVVRTVTVISPSAPVISLLGSATVTIEVGAPYRDAEATALDDLDGDISNQIVLTGIVRNTQIGVYTLSYNVTDSGGNAATTVVRTVRVTPVISALTAAITAAQALHDGATEGVSAGEYAVGSKATFQTAIDAAGAVKASALLVAAGQAEVDGAAATLSGAVTVFSDGKVTEESVVLEISALSAAINSVQAFHDGATEGVEVGQYASDSKKTLQTAIDAATAVKTLAEKGAASQKEVDAAIATLTDAITAFLKGKVPGETQDITPPILTLLGNATVTLLVGSAYQDAGATALDDVDGDLTSSIITIGSVTPSAVGIYTLTYNVYDGSGNSAETVTRTVRVVASDIIAPVITLLGSATVTIEVGAPYRDAEATALDDLDGDISNQIVLTGIVRNTQIGVYTLSYNVTDSGGNAATTVVRTVRVTPVISALTAAITAAQALHDGATEGVSSGEYAVGSKATFQTAIDAAGAVKASALLVAAGQAEVDGAAATLSAAATTFANGEVIGGGPIGGDI